MAFPNTMLKPDDNDKLVNLDYVVVQIDIHTHPLDKKP